MNIVCLICSELLNSTDIVSTLCGHIFHRLCLEPWLNNNSTSCPTCRQSATKSTLIKLFFEFDDQKANLQLDDILKTNEDLQISVNEMKDKTKKMEIELREVQIKLREATANEKRLERQKQIDEMTIAGIRGIKNESTKEIIKLNQIINNLRLDLLAEKQLRRIHQTTLHELKPNDENYNLRSIKLDETVNTGLSTDVSLSTSAPVVSVLNETPQFTILDFNKKAVVPDQHVKEVKYIIPSKIQKANKEIKAGRLVNFKNQRSLWNKSDKKPVGFQFQPPSEPSTSSAAILSKNQKRAFGEGLVFSTPISTTTSASTLATGSSFFNFPIDSPTFPLVSSSTSSANSSFVISTPLRNYRDVQESPSSPGPKISDR